MTRIKKRRTGKKRTEDQLKKAAGRRRARKDTKEETVEKKPVAKELLTPEQKAAYKKSFKPVPAGRRNRAAGKAADFKKESSEFKGKPPQNKSANAGKTGKTRSAGSRRIAVAKSIASNTGNKPVKKKSSPPKSDESTEGKAPKGFAPWNKNKFRKK